MSVKYRVRLKTERVIGPFSTEEIGELYQKDHIIGTELCQQFPIGDWKPLQNFHELKELVDGIERKKSKMAKAASDSITATSAVKPNTTTSSVETMVSPMHIVSEEVQRPNQEKSITNRFNEFKFGKGVPLEVNYEELEKKYVEENPEAPIKTRPKHNMEKTVVLRKFQEKPANLDKTVVIPRQISNVGTLSEAKSVKEVKPIVEIKVSAPARPQAQMVTDKTEFINLAQALPTINAQLSVSEVELEKQARIEESQEKRRLRELQEIMLKEQAIEDGSDEEDVEVIEEFSREKNDFEHKVIIKKKRKSMSIIAILAFLGIFYFFTQPDESVKITGPLYVDIKFPITSAVANVPAANAALLKGRTLYAQGTYKKRAMASGFYLTSLQQRFDGNEALGDIILTYSELIDNTRERHQAANTIYKFIQLAETKLLSDPTVATGTALFYGKIGKYQTGVYTIKNYLRAGNKPTPKMLTYYLNLLSNAGELVEARKIYETLKSIPKKPFESYYELAEFNILDDKVPEAKVLIEEGLKYYPGSVLLLLQYADILIKEQSLVAFEEVLSKIKKSEAESSPDYLASYYKFMGYFSALNKKNKEASQFFIKSLKIKESDELRSILSRLEVGGDSMAQKLILESKVIGLMKKSKEEYKNRNIDNAFQFIIEAVDADPEYVPAVLFQAQLNTSRGFFESAIFSLQRIIGLNPHNSQLKKALIEVYIKSYKFDEAERMLAEMAQTKFAITPDYAALMGLFSEVRRNSVLALRWYDRALKRDPLNDEVMFKMAKIFVRTKRFSDGRKRLAKALLLDPKNVNYHALYSEILYEQDGTDTAIGYLRDIITEIGEDPILISAITTVYFKSGQLKEFQSYYKKVQSLSKKEEGFYEVLIAAAKLEGRKDEYIQHCRDLLKINPGNLKIRMELGELFYDEGRFDDAIAEFSEIKDKLESYPRVHYQLAKVYLAKNDIDKARTMALKELELNPNLESAHFIVGEVHRINKEYREAIIKYEKAISLNPKSTDALIAMATIRLAQNYANDSLELLGRALKEDISNPAIHKLMGDAYRAAGQRALAKEKYESYLKLNPGAQDKDLIDSLIRNLK